MPETIQLAATGELFVRTIIWSLKNIEEFHYSIDNIPKPIPRVK